MQIDFEGCTVLAEDKSAAQLRNLEPNDTYIAKRNTGWKLLTVREVDYNTSCVFPKEPAYVFDTWECFKVISIT